MNNHHGEHGDKRLKIEGEDHGDVKVTLITFKLHYVECLNHNIHLNGMDVEEKSISFDLIIVAIPPSDYKHRNMKSWQSAMRCKFIHIKHDLSNWLTC